MLTIMFYRAEPVRDSIDHVDDEGLREIVESAHAKMFRRLDNFAPKYAAFIRHRDLGIKECNFDMAKYKAETAIFGNGDFPAELRYDLQFNVPANFKLLFEGLLVNDSKWAYLGKEVGTGDNLRDGFLFSVMKDEDLPWDLKAIDW